MVTAGWEEAPGKGWRRGLGAGVAVAAAAVLALTASQARATVVSPPSTMTLTIDGTYLSIPGAKTAPDPDPFPSKDFTFSITLPDTMAAEKKGGHYVSEVPLSGTYTDGGVTESFSDAFAVFVPSAKVHGVRGETVRFIIPSFDVAGDIFRISLASTSDLWTVDKIDGADLVTLDIGTLSVDTQDTGGTATYRTPEEVADHKHGDDPAFEGSLIVPEPPAAALLGFGLLAMAGLARRRVSGPRVSQP